jgi:hypothetical protein
VVDFLIKTPNSACFKDTTATEPKRNTTQFGTSFEKSKSLWYYTLELTLSKLGKLKIGKHPGCMSLNSSTFLSQLTPEDAITHKLLPNFPSFVASWRQSQKLEAKGYFLDLRCYSLKVQT